MFNLVGGISSSARMLPELNGEKLIISRGKGAYLWDDKGRRYIDTALGFGAVILGHADDRVTSSVITALADSATPSWSHVREHRAPSTEHRAPSTEHRAPSSYSASCAHRRVDESYFR